MEVDTPSYVASVSCSIFYLYTQIPGECQLPYRPRYSFCPTYETPESTIRDLARGKRHGASIEDATEFISDLNSTALLLNRWRVGYLVHRHTELYNQT